MALGLAAQLCQLLATSKCEAEGTDEDGDEDALKPSRLFGSALHLLWLCSGEAPRAIRFKFVAADCNHNPCMWTLTYGRKGSLSLQQAHPLSLPQSHSQEEPDRWRPRPSYCHRFDAGECRMLNHPHGIRLARRLIDERRTRPHHSCHRRRRFTVCEERWLCKRIRKSIVCILWA